MLKALTLSFLAATFFNAQSAQALNSSEISSAITQTNNGSWAGTYSVVYYPMQDANTANPYFAFGKGAGKVWQSKDMSLNFGTAADQTPLKSGGDLVTYQYFRTFIPQSVESDMMSCFGQGPFVGDTIPRQVIIKSELLAHIENDSSLTAADKKTKKMETEGFFQAVMNGWSANVYDIKKSGRKANLKMKSPVVALIFGKKCHPGYPDDGKDLLVPVTELSVSRDANTNEVTGLLMKAVVEPYDSGAGLLQGFSIYQMSPGSHTGHLD